MCYRAGKYTVCGRVRASFSPEISHAGTVKGLITRRKTTSPSCMQVHTDTCACANTHYGQPRNYVIIVQLRFPFVRTLTTYDLDVGPFIQVTEALFQRLQRFNQHSVSKGKRKM